MSPSFLKMIVGSDLASSVCPGHEGKTGRAFSITENMLFKLSRARVEP